MRSFTVHHPEEEFRIIADSPDDTILVRDGFCWAAFIFPPIWLCARGLWLELAGYALAIVVVMGLSNVAGIDFVAVLGIFLALNFLVGLEGKELLRWKLSRAGFHTVAVVQAESLEAAERRFFENLFTLAGNPPLRVEKEPQAAFSKARPGTVWADQGRTEEDDIVGLFPRPEGKA